VYQALLAVNFQDNFLHSKVLDLAFSIVCIRPSYIVLAVKFQDLNFLNFKVLDFHFSIVCNMTVFHLSPLCVRPY
jgi:hypothetical protein